MDTNQAAEALGFSVRHFRKVYIDTGKLEALQFNPAVRGHSGGRRHKLFFRTSDVERVKRER